MLPAEDLGRQGPATHLPWEGGSHNPLLKSAKFGEMGPGVMVNVTYTALSLGQTQGLTCPHPAVCQVSPAWGWLPEGTGASCKKGGGGRTLGAVASSFLPRGHRGPGCGRSCSLRAPKHSGTSWRCPACKDAVVLARFLLGPSEAATVTLLEEKQALLLKTFISPKRPKAPRSRSGKEVGTSQRSGRS